MRIFALLIVLFTMFLSCKPCDCEIASPKQESVIQKQEQIIGSPEDKSVADDSYKVMGYIIGEKPENYHLYCSKDVLKELLSVNELLQSMPKENVELYSKFHPDYVEMIDKCQKTIVIIFQACQDMADKKSARRRQL